jgi:hypothetical protein
MGLAELIGSLRSVTNCVHGVGRGGVVWSGVRGVVRLTCSIILLLLYERDKYGD